MDPITNNLIFPSPSTGSSTDPIPADNYDPTLRAFEQMVDQFVLNDQKNAQNITQAAIQKQEKIQAFEQKVAFLTGALHQAETAMAGVSESAPPAATNPQDPSAASATESAYQRSQLAYWKSKLTEAENPDGTMGLL